MITRCRVVISMHASVPTFGLCCISSAIICAFRSPRDSDDYGPEGVDRLWIVRRDQTVAANQTWSARCRVFALRGLAPASTPFLYRGRTLPTMEQNGSRNFHRGDMSTDTLLLAAELVRDKLQ